MIQQLFADTPVLQGLSIWTLVSWVGFVLALLCIPSILIQRRERPMAALAWILCLFQLPILGILMWWLFGLTHMRRRRRKRRLAIQEIDVRLKDHRDRLQSLDHERDEISHGEESAEQEEEEVTTLNKEETTADEGSALINFFDIESGIFPTSSGNHVTAYTNARDAFAAFAEAIRQAKDHVHFEFYIWEDDETGRRFRDLLIECAERGVEVRALYDAIGGSRVNGKFMKKLERAGGKTAPFLPVTLLERRLRINFRNHRKIIVIDGRIAFTGGINIADEYLEWHDTAYRFEGPVAYQFQEVFAEDWFFATRQDIVDERYFPGSHEPPRDPDPTHTHPQGARARLLASGPDMRAQAIHKAFFLAMTSASDRLWMTTPYFIPDEAIAMALETAALRGVDVRIILPDRDATDVFVTYWAGRAFYDRLLEAGVKIYEFSGRILHAKSLILDDRWSFVGSSNMDIRSFRLNFETNCIIEDTQLNQTLSQFFEGTLHECKRVDLDAFRERPTTHRLFEGFTRLFSPLL